MDGWETTDNADELEEAEEAEDAEDAEEVEEVGLEEELSREELGKIAEDELYRVMTDFIFERYCECCDDIVKKAAQDTTGKEKFYNRVNLDIADLTIAYMLVKMKEHPGSAVSSLHVVENEMSSIISENEFTNRTITANRLALLRIRAAAFISGGDVSDIDLKQLDERTSRIRNKIDTSFIDTFKRKYRKSIKNSLKQNSPLSPEWFLSKEARVVTGKENINAYAKARARAEHAKILEQAKDKNNRAQEESDGLSQQSLPVVNTGIPKAVFVPALVASALVGALATAGPANVINNVRNIASNGGGGENQHELVLGEDPEAISPENDKIINDAIQRLNEDLSNESIVMTTEERNASSIILGLLQSETIDGDTLASIDAIKKAAVMKLLENTQLPYGSNVLDFTYENGELVLKTDSGQIALVVQDTNLQGALENDGKVGLAYACAIDKTEIAVERIETDQGTSIEHLVIRQQQQQQQNYSDGYNNPSYNDYYDSEYDY